MQHESLLEQIIAHIFGHKYYANIINMKGTLKPEVSSFIFCTRREADAHREKIQWNQSFQYLETISFRSRNNYSPKQPVRRT